VQWKQIFKIGATFGALGAIPFSYIVGLAPPHGLGDILSVIFLAIGAGAMFGLTVGLITGSKMNARQTAIDLSPGEILERSALANHVLNMESRGGRLHLTNQRLVFKPSRLNVQKALVSIPRSQITDVSKAMTLGIIPNALAVTQSDGAIENFKVSDRATWLRMITQSQSGAAAA
jgi:GRAM domain